MSNRYAHYSLDALKQMHRRETDYVKRKLMREPAWLGSKSFHERMRKIHMLQHEISCRESNLTLGI